MNHLFLIVLTLKLLSNADLGQAQGIRAVNDTVLKPVRKPVQPILPITYKGRQIMVGSGGGFTGFTTTYYLLDNGKLFGRRSRDTTFTFIRKQTTAQTKRMFSTVEGTCKIKKTAFDHPGNLYKFVQWRKGNQSYKVTWGASGKKVAATYPKFYDSFMAMIPASFRLK